MNFLLPFTKVTSIKKIGFDDILTAIKYPNNFLIINTLPKNEQEFLIYQTVKLEIEEQKINEIIDSGKMMKYKILIYGKNSTDQTVEIKYNKLLKFGFTQVYIYYGGLFEWCLLRDIYGEDLFPIITTNKINNIDILKWKPECVFNS